MMNSTAQPLPPQPQQPQPPQPQSPQPQPPQPQSPQPQPQDPPQAQSPRPRGASGAAAKRVDSLDGLRTIAVALVMAVHAGVPGFALGWLGVDIFFVLSGFLITTLLVRERQKHGSINLPKFWARRFLRLMPAYWLYIGALTLAMLLTPGALHPHGGWSPGGYIGSLWGYYVNYAPKGGIWDYQKLAVHLWSLAVEEQFYLIWPTLLFVLLRFRWNILAGWALVAGIFVYRLLVPDGRLESLLPTRGLGILLGCAVALTLAQYPLAAVKRQFARTFFRWGWLIGTVLSVGLLTWALKRGWMSETDIQRRYLAVLVVFFAGTIAMLWYGPVDRLARLLAYKPLVYLGQISYGLYLYHMVAHFLVWDVLTGSMEHWPHAPKFILRLMLFAGLTVGIASASYYLLEKPFLKLKERLH